MNATTGSPTSPNDRITSGTGQTPELPAVLIRFGDTHTSPFQVGGRAPLPPLPPYSAPPAPAVSPQPGRSRRRAVQVAAGVLAVLVVVTAVVVIRNSDGPSPRELVQQWFDQLADRDSDALYAGGKCSSNPLCGTAALSTGYLPPTNMHIDGEQTIADHTSSRGSKQQSVTVSYDLDGRRVTDHVGLDYYKQNFFGGYWSITKPPGATLTFPGPTRSVIKMAGAELPPITADVPVTVWAPPGVYTASKAGTALLEPSQITITISAADTVTTGDPQEPRTVVLPDTVKPAVSEQVLRQIHERIDACAAQRVFAPDTDLTLGTIDTCPLRHSTKYAITDDPTWTVLQYPQVRLDPRPDDTLTVTTTTAGRASIHYRWTMYLRDPREWYDVDAVEDIVVAGRVTANQGTPTWTTD
ncbi:hypothetical protein OHA72_10220 [Dactylosporangium sp. NBC_01737]|uniref:hypothetical protein n=1 Tax=Dactylosporangium sp. NBC_01737 TaxID=2975959 RepID=UPI002E142ACD|nr:hypothetical protein OHA72_10220 [Dactylosporangium sp. NBC_01737]